MTEICKLCRREAKLIKSHYIPKALYKAVAHTSSLSSESLVHVNRPKREVFSSDKQQKDYLLCTDCEQRFSKEGETVVVGGSYKSEDQFTLRSQLESMPPSSTSSNGNNHYYGENLSSLTNFKKYIYFALSIVWRGSVGRWSESYNSLSGALGDKYSELFRQYLLNPTHLPEKTAVIINVDFDSPSKMGMFASPTASRKSTSVAGARVYTVMIPGIFFSIMVGGDVDKMLRSSLILDRVMFNEWSFTNSPQYRDIVAVTQASSVKGKLANQLSTSTRA
jgi:hypothetical protein